LSKREYEHDSRSTHLIIKDAPKDAKKIVTNGWEVSIDQVFTIGIIQLVQDINDSVYGHGGYFDKFETDKTLRDNFRSAVEAFYDVRP